MAMEISDLFRAAAHVQSSGVQPLYGYLATGKPNSGFNSGVPIVRNGAGDYTLTLNEAVGLNEISVLIVPTGAAVASANKSFGWTLVTPTTIRVTSLQEGAAGAASALTDLDFDIVVMKYPQT